MIEIKYTYPFQKQIKNHLLIFSLGITAKHMQWQQNGCQNRTRRNLSHISEHQWMAYHLHSRVISIHTHTWCVLMR